MSCSFCRPCDPRDGVSILPPHLPMGTACFGPLRDNISIISHSAESSCQPTRLELTLFPRAALKGGAMFQLLIRAYNYEKMTHLLEQRWGKVRDNNGGDIARVKAISKLLVMKRRCIRIGLKLSEGHEYSYCPYSIHSVSLFLSVSFLA